MTSLLIQIDGQIIYEHYFRGYSGDDLFELQSVTKSFSSALIGIAVDNGYIDSVAVDEKSHDDQYETLVTSLRQRVTDEPKITGLAIIAKVNIGNNAK